MLFEHILAMERFYSFFSKASLNFAQDNPRFIEKQAPAVFLLLHN
jgi:hypothetical protein